MAESLWLAFPSSKAEYLAKAIDDSVRNIQSKL